MDVWSALADWAQACGAEPRRDKDRLTAEWTVAQREAGHLRLLRYRLQFEVDEPDRTVLVHETLFERGASDTVELAPDLRPRDEAYRVGTIWERTAYERQSQLLKLTYDKVDFDFAQLRHKLEKLCQRMHYKVRQLIPV
ncbi:MAG: hypothetical protein QOD77_822 [Thermoplasmata archaeon]|jgi:hypothetical protein|nr:hypothetical protein [Thermoplasmata archaeon]